VKLAHQLPVVIHDFLMLGARNIALVKPLDHVHLACVMQGFFPLASCKRGTRRRCSSSLPAYHWAALPNVRLGFSIDCAASGEWPGPNRFPVATDVARPAQAGLSAEPPPAIGP
jgi:hypothetical protein